MHSMRLFTCYVMNAMMALCDAAANPGRRLVSIFDMSHCAMANIDVACLTMILVGGEGECRTVGLFLVYVHILHFIFQILVQGCLVIGDAASP
jgi:hypothetical protein